ncbi:hypothetical protein GCM10011351_07980 [Paraliobacillus quinghaiensis]|uniref:Uncharacterized protein n=1 Tax=Paraliobacillus quinghaiensis TaxID=470815 RepID=A0A917TKY8_9BACI|nr:hypothetical protein [Paraliobacillus quinghaiensis]GGM24636.1 hypothetical protein GCM10011351_07980 [Paraliobacillus quinghaiensis]
MSEEKKEPKKVIHVKDLVIKADNVYFEPQQEQHRPYERQRPFDAFFGQRREEGPHERVEAVQEEEYKEDKHEEVEEEILESKDEHKEERNERRPFSWL